MVVDYHALNFIQNKDEMKKLTKEVVIDYLALGFDTEKNIIFKQSDVQEHTELAWIFDTITTVPYLKRAHAYKDAVDKGNEEAISMGTFNYPMLMAADILLYNTDIVPVGQDQKQHIEYARDIANKFNFTYDEKNANGDVVNGTFKLPEDYILPDVKVVPGIDGRKMSKSYKNHIPLFANDEEIKKLCMSIVTDTAAIADKKNADENNIFNIYRVVASREESEVFRAKLENGGVGYGDLKEELAEKIISFVKPMREKRESISDEYVFKVMKKGAIKANEVANKKMTEVREKAGIIRNI
jgi:tryptophanyl-tRNA synthetase